MTVSWEMFPSYFWVQYRVQYMVSWLLTGAPEQRYWQNRETANVGLDSSVGRAPARQYGGRRFKSRSSQFSLFIQIYLQYIELNICKICKIYAKYSVVFLYSLHIYGTIQSCFILVLFFTHRDTLQLLQQYGSNASFTSFWSCDCNPCNSPKVINKAPSYTMQRAYCYLSQAKYV